MTHRMRKCFGATPAEALRRDYCGSAQARHLGTCYGETPAEAL